MSGCGTDTDTVIDSDNDNQNSSVTSIIEIMYDSEISISGFQFDMTNVSIESVSGGDAGAAGFMLSNSPSRVIGFSLSGSQLEMGNGVLVLVEIQDSSTPACLSNLVISGSGGVPLNGIVENCLTIIISEI